MSIQPLRFLDTSIFTAMLLVKYRERMVDLGDVSLLELRAIRGDDPEPADRPVLREWKGARALLSRIRTAAAPYFNGEAVELGNVTIETLNPGGFIPWSRDEGEYADGYVRLRIALVSCPGAMSYCGPVAAGLAVGMVNLVDHRALCSEVNFGEYARTHLIVDVRRPDDV